jgi:hypothetical protein
MGLCLPRRSLRQRFQKLVVGLGCQTTWKQHPNPNNRKTKVTMNGVIEALHIYDEHKWVILRSTADSELN